MPRLLAVLTMTVLVAAIHWWLLAEVPWNTRPTAAQPTEATPVFDTRSIAAPALPVPPPPPPPPAPAPRPKPRPPAPRPVPQTPVPVPESATPALAEAAAPTVTEPEAVEPSTPEPSTSASDAADAQASAVSTPHPTPPDENDDGGLAAPSTAASAGAALAPPQGITLRTAPGQPTQTTLPYQAPPAQRLVFQVQGQVKGFSYSASAQLLWRTQGLSYQASQEISAFLLGARSQVSQGQITAEGLQPERFEDRARKKLRAAHLDWASGLARFEPDAPLARIAPGTQDRLSVFLQLAGMLAAAPQRYPQGAEITLPTASTKAVEPWAFQVQDVQALELPAGTLEALRLERLPRRAGDQKAELWLAPALGYLPVRIRLSEGQGDYADLRLQSHNTP